MKFLKNLLNLQTKNINLAAFILAFTSFFSALLGLIRDRLLAGTFGLGDELDIYYAAFRIPDFIAMTLIIGAIGAAIIPIFSECLCRDKKEAFYYLSNLLNIFLIFLIFISGILFIFSPTIISLFLPGFSPEKKELTVFLTRIMLLSPIFLGLSNIISAILRVFQRFLISSLAPIMYNLGIIIGILFFFPLIGLSGLAWGVVFGGILHLLIQLPVLKNLGFKVQKIFNPFEKKFIQTIKLTIPRSLALAVNQINLLVVTFIASFLSTGSIGALNLAEGLSRPIFTFFGVSFSTAAFPFLSLAFAKKNKKKFNQIFFSTFSKILLLSLSLSLLFFLFRHFFVELIFKTGKFGSFDAQLTAALFGLFLLGIFAQSLLLLIAKAFFALQNTKTPALISFFGLISNIFLCLLFVKLLSFSNPFQNFLIRFLNLSDLKNIQLLGLPLALSLSAIFQFLILFFLLWRKIKEID